MTRPTDDPELDPRSSLVKVRIGGETYDALHSSTCHTCTHPARTAIEEKVLLSYAYPEIAKMYSEREVEDREHNLVRLPSLSWQSIRRHYLNGHMPLELAASRAVVERRAQALGQEIEEATGRIIEHRDVVQDVLERGHDLLATGKIEPDVKDTLAAAKLLADLDARVGDQVDADAWSSAMQIFFETAQKMMPPDLWRRFNSELSKNPVLRALEAKQNGDVVDAEVVSNEPS